jgi:hypothetical protein
MVAAQLLAFAFLVGVTVCGLSGTLLELLASRPLRFGEPFLSRQKPLRSLAATALAGPLMLANDALFAFRASRISIAGLASSAVIAAAWALATGVVVLDVAAWALLG